MPLNRAPRILIVEDEPGIASFLERGLANQGFRVSVVATGGAAIQAAASDVFDAAVLDLMLPDLDGLDVCRSLRQGSAMGVIMLTARDMIGDKVRGLAAGADDYLAKPFALEELLARIRAVLRRTGSAGSLISVGDIEIDTDRRQARRAGRSLELTTREFDLLTLLAQHAGRPLRHELILASVWGHDSDAGPDVVKVYINYLRQKLNADGQQDPIKSIRGFGYVLEESA